MTPSQPHESDGDPPWDRVLHLHAQGGHHEEAFIVGNTKALEALRDAINRALHADVGASHQFTADGEGYEVLIARDDDQNADSKWALPYTQEYASETREHAIWPAARRIFQTDTKDPTVGDDW